MGCSKGRCWLDRSKCSSWVRVVNPAALLGGRAIIAIDRLLSMIIVSAIVAVKWRGWRTLWLLLPTEDSLPSLVRHVVLNTSVEGNWTIQSSLTADDVGGGGGGGGHESPLVNMAGAPCGTPITSTHTSCVLGGSSSSSGGVTVLSRRRAFKMSRGGLLTINTTRVAVGSQV